MNEKWNNRDLKLKAEKKRVGEADTTQKEWTRHIAELAEGEPIRWATYSGFYRTPYEGDHAYRFTLLEAGDHVRIKALRESGVEMVELDDFEEWTSEWYEVDGWCHRVSICVMTSLYAVSELPPNVRTMQQTDHDAWDYAVRNGLI